MLRFLTRSLAAAVDELRPHRPRLARRTAPSLIGLECRALLSSSGAETPLPELVRLEARDGELDWLSAAKVSKQVKFVDSLYKEYFHRGPDAPELSYALQLLASGVSHKALTADFKDATSKTGRGVTEEAFVSALYVTIAGRSATSVGLEYWEGFLVSGYPRADVRERFTFSDGVLPPPQITWVPASISAGTRAGS